MSALAKIAYRPLGLAGSMLAGVAAGAVVKQIWKRVADADDAPAALESEYSLRTVLLGAALQGLVFAVIKAAVDRGGARLFERATGAWPGD
ncbi:MAG TPA: DUF4235 domain-containing protein [Microlunatus sp.]|nr:DUF4235 domain-containing protein [Microlunatus sp.]